MSSTRHAGRLDGSPLTRRQVTAVAIIAMLAGSAACIAVAALLMPDSYSAVEHSVSESAAQGVEDAWVARVGFLLLATAVFMLAGFAGDRWGVWGRSAHRAYGASMVTVAAFAHRPWEDVPFDRFEDFLHSVGAFGVGFAFTAGVLIVSFRRPLGAVRARIFDWVAVAAAFILPMIMFNVTGIGGLVQRILFGVGYLWYGTEAVLSAGYTEVAADRQDSETRRARPKTESRRGGDEPYAAIAAS